MSFSKAFDFTGDVALVTGAGSRMDGMSYNAISIRYNYANMPLVGEIGNGRAAAILLARQGAKVALVDYNVDWAKETKRMIDEEGGISEVFQADVTKEEDCKNAVAKTVELFGALHILVNIGKLEPAESVAHIDERF